ncbi:MAG: hypothetical protein ABS76_26515 [Pelagibacterium sp. SCN 64-44]|nr:MAG: hypothetical protein ABS76_26515 [Pelagibacterium sp. SCN 64-44]
MDYRTGDLVRMSGEDLVVAYFDKSQGLLAFCGYPMSWTEVLENVTLVKSVTDEEFLKLCDEIWDSGGARAQGVMRCHGEEAKRLRTPPMPTFKVIEDSSDDARVICADDAEAALDQFLEGRDFCSEYPDGDLYFVDDENGVRTTFEVSTDWSPSFNIFEKKSA